jgi:MYXO-CTERM domain-containing protein
MRGLSSPAVVGLLALVCAMMALTAAKEVGRPISDPSLYALAGGGLILLGLIRRRRKQ